MVSKPALASQRDKAQVAEEGDNWVRSRMWDQLYLAWDVHLWISHLSLSEEGARMQFYCCVLDAICGRSVAP